MTISDPTGADKEKNIEQSTEGADAFPSNVSDAGYVKSRRTAQKRKKSFVIRRKIPTAVPYKERPSGDKWKSRMAVIKKIAAIKKGKSVSRATTPSLRADLPALPMSCMDMIEPGDLITNDTYTADMSTYRSQIGTSKTFSDIATEYTGQNLNEVEGASPVIEITNMRDVNEDFDEDYSTGSASESASSGTYPVSKFTFNTSAPSGSSQQGVTPLETSDPPSASRVKYSFVSSNASGAPAAARATSKRAAKTPDAPISSVMPAIPTDQITSQNKRHCQFYEYIGTIHVASPPIKPQSNPGVLFAHKRSTDDAYYAATWMVISGAKGERKWVHCKQLDPHPDQDLHPGKVLAIRPNKYPTWVARKTAQDHATEDRVLPVPESVDV